MKEDGSTKRCIAVVGGGGKTSFLFWQAARYLALGKRVILATSTHMAHEPAHPFADWEDTDTLKERLSAFGYCVVGVRLESQGKITCPENPDWGKLLSYAEVLLVEADGAKRLPLKVPGQHEPVIPPLADTVVALAGLDCVGKKLEETCHRASLAAEFLKKKPGDPVEMEDVAKICTSTEGFRKSVGPRNYEIILNKADTVQLRTLGLQVKERIYEMAPEIPVSVLSLRKKNTAVILLAAGSSTRFGKENKLLYPILGKPMICHILDQVKRLEVGSVTVVTQYDSVAELARREGAKVLYNLHPEEGISSSLKLGIGANPAADAWLFCVCDQPYLRFETLWHLLETFYESPRQIAAVSSQGKIGNPCIFSRAYREELLQLTGDVGGKHVIVRHRDDTVLYEVGDARELMDIDRRNCELFPDILA